MRSALCPSTEQIRIPVPARLCLEPTKHDSVLVKSKLTFYKSIGKTKIPKKSVPAQGTLCLDPIATR